MYSNEPAQSYMVNSMFTMTNMVKLERRRKEWTKYEMKKNNLKAPIYTFLMKAKTPTKNTLTKYTADFVTFENVNHSFLNQ